MNIRPATKDDAWAVWGSPPLATFRGLVVEDEGEILALAGVMHTHPHQAFMTMYEPLKSHRKTIVRAIREFRNILSKYSGPIYAFPNEFEPTARGFLSYTGFTPESDEVYKWTQ
jgi:hypothetical protein